MKIRFEWVAIYFTCLLTGFADGSEVSEHSTAIHSQSRSKTPKDSGILPGWTQLMGNRPSVTAPNEQSGADVLWEDLCNTSPAGANLARLPGSGPNCPEWWVAWNRLRSVFFEKGLRYSQLYPDDPRIYSWMLMTVTWPPLFWADDSQGASMCAKGTPENSIISTDRERRYKNSHMYLREKFLDPTNVFVDREMRCVYLGEELTGDLERVLYSAKRGEIVDASDIAARALDLATMFPHERRYVPYVIRTIFLELGNGAKKAAYMRLAHQSPNRYVRWQAEAASVLRRWRNEPVELPFQNCASEHFTLAEYSGKPVLVSFLSPACSSYVSALQRLNVLHDRFSSQGLQIVSVWFYFDETVTSRIELEEIIQPVRQRWVQRIERIVGDKDQHPLRKTLGILSMPEYILLDREGRMVEVGPTLLFSRNLETMINKLLP